ncbi:hypothetical protein ACLI08_08340 [Flavobacterium sp. RNTU_13]|uniref:hypothetical protein n=1 Tax=Flavobacterium sp. RNTU_13 TaxID=3375145 RepID=UPI0039874800
MEQFYKDSSFESFELRVTEEAKNHLRVAGGWGLFISIVGFIIIGLSLLMSFIVMVGAGNMPAGAMPFNPAVVGVFMLVFNIFWAIPVVTLFRFSIKARNAVADMNTEQLTQAFANLKYNLMFAGILIILSIVMYFVLIIAVVSTAAAGLGGRF